MPIEETAEQREIREMVGDLMARRSGEDEVRRLMATEAGYDPGLWAQLAELGLTGLTVPERYGGAGLGQLELGVVLEEMGAALLCAPYFASSVLATSVLLAAADEAVNAALLPELADGSRIGAFAYEPEEAGGGRTPTVAASRREDGEWRLSGRASFVVDGHVADLLVVAARAPSGLALFVVDGDVPGLARAPMETLDMTRKQAALTFEEVSARMVGEPGDGAASAERALDLARIGLAAEQVGGARRALGLSVEYAKERHQFDRPIGSFQAIKHKCAEMLVAVELAGAAAVDARAAAVERSGDLALAASVAQLICSNAYVDVAAEAIQVHGGIGFTWEHPAHLYFRRAQSAKAMLGGPSFHRERLARLGALEPSVEVAA